MKVMMTIGGHCQITINYVSYIVWISSQPFHTWAKDKRSWRLALRERKGKYFFCIYFSFYLGSSVWPILSRSHSVPLLIKEINQLYVLWREFRDTYGYILILFVGAVWPIVLRQHSVPLIKILNKLLCFLDRTLRERKGYSSILLKQYDQFSQEATVCPCLKINN